MKTPVSTSKLAAVFEKHPGQPGIAIENRNMIVAGNGTSALFGRDVPGNTVAG